MLEPVFQTGGGAGGDSGPLPPGPAGAAGALQDDHLETMLGNLNTDMSRQGIMTIPKGHCAACAKPIVGQVGYNRSTECGIGASSG